MGPDDSGGIPRWRGRLDPPLVIHGSEQFSEWLYRNPALRFR